MILLGGSFLFINPAFSQSVGCTQNLADAQAQFDIGNLPGIPKMLEECISSKSFSPEQNVQAHKLITLVHLYQDDQENADIWMSRLLVVDPEHKLDPTVDPAEIIFLKEKFRYRPIFRISAGAGVNRAAYRLVTQYSTNSTDLEAVYTPGTDLNGYFQIEKEVYNGLDLGLGVGYAGRRYTGEEVIGFEPRASDNLESDANLGNLLTYTESQSAIEAPIFAKYTYYGAGDNKWNPYVLAGASASYVIGATQTIQRQNLSENSTSVNNPDINLMDDERRKSLNYYAFGGLGVKIRRKTNFLFVEVRYNYGMNQIVDDNGRYPLQVTQTSNKQNLFGALGYVDDNFALDGFMALVGFQYSIYKPKKISEATLK